MPPATPSFDPGLTQQYTGPLLRAINKDGSFNVRRRGLRGLAGSVYMHLVNLSWPGFWGLVALAYLAANIVFASLYTLLGPGSLRAAEDDIGLGAFGRAFFFSVHTLTTVGYGDLYPLGLAANIVASAEAAVGLMGFAVATGLLFARFSRPNAQLVFSNRMVVAPYRDGHSLQFRMANRRNNVLTDVLVDMMLMTVEQDAEGQLRRNFVELKLERRKIFFLALTWTVVHPIDESSPLKGMKKADLERMQAEVLILIRGYDDSFTQVVNTRYSYRWEEVEWSARFAPAFEVSSAGHLVLDLDRISETSPVTNASRNP
ncbi:MAG TPA: ion channel [Bryobacteraceae bacterium]|jgi:inward rectifier potassium channel|nr:ion channel [Bryobacteraceae bacterium]